MKVVLSHGRGRSLGVIIIMDILVQEFLVDVAEIIGASNFRLERRCDFETKEFVPVDVAEPRMSSK